MRMLVAGADDQAAADPGLLRVIARAHDIQGRLSQNTDLTVHDIAREERVTAAYIYTLLRLPWLAPDITTAIVNGRHPQQLNAKTLMRKASRLPADWTDATRILKNLAGAAKRMHVRSSARSLLDVSLLTRLQQKSKPRNARREIFAYVLHERTDEDCLC